MTIFELISPHRTFLEIHYIHNIQMNYFFPSTAQTKVDRQSLEFKDGIIQSYLTQPSNSISTNQYTIYSSPTLLFWFCIRPGNLFLICCCILVNTLKLQTSYDISFYIFPLLISFIFYGAKEIKFDLSTRESDKKINNSITRVCNKDGVEDINWGNLKVGDIVYLKQGDHVPADILLLDSQELQHRSAIAYVDTSLISGYSKIDKKKAAYLSQLQSRGIQKQNWSRYKQILTGKLTYSPPTMDYNEFTGYLKLVKDPKVQQLSIQNIILRGSIIKRSLWIFGMVVHAGHSCKIVMHQKRFTDRKRFPFFIGYCEKMIALALGIGIVLSLVFTIVHIHGLYISFAQTFIHYFLLFSPTIPYYLYPTLDIVSFILWWKHKDIINMKNPMVLPEIGCLDYLFLSKNGVLATGQVVIKEIMTPSCIYRIQEPQNDEKKTRNSRRSACRSEHIPSIVASILSSSSARPLEFDKVISEANMTQSDQFEIDDQQFTEKDFDSNINDKMYQFEPLVLDKHKMLRNIMEEESQALTAALSMTLCHQAKLFYIHNDSQYKGISHNPVDQVLLKFCKSLGINYAFFKKTDKYNMIKIIIKQDHMIFQLAGAHQFKKKRDRVGVVVKRNNISTVIVKGSAEKMLNIMNLKEDERMRLENKIAEYKEQGVQPIIFAKREMSAAEFSIYQSQYLSVRLALTTTEKQTEEFVNKYEKDLNFVAMIGMADQLSPNYNNLAITLSDLGIKFGILTSDLADTTINVSKKFISKAYKSSIQYIKLDQGSRSEIKYQVSQTLTLIKNKEEFDFVLIISQNTVDAVYASYDLLQHFLYLIYKSKSIIAYGLNSDVIGTLVKSIKDSSPISHTVMSVGYSTYSLEMFKESDVSVSFHVDADIKVNNLKQLILLLKNGKHFFHVTITTISSVIYVCLMLLAIFIVYQLLCYNYINVAIEPSMIWILSNIFMLWSIFICIITVLSKQTEENKNPARYTAIRKQIFRHYFLLVLLKGITHGAVIALCVAFILPQARISRIFSFTKASQNIIILLEVISISLFRHFVKSSIPIIYRALIVIATYVIMIASLAIRQALRTNVQFSYMYCIFLSYSSVVLIINTFVFNIAATYMYDQVIRNMIFPLLADFSSFQKTRIKSMKHLQQQKLITYMFRQVQQIDTNVMESINEWGIDYTSMKFNNQLEFINQSLNYKYLFQNIDSDIKTFIVACIIYGTASFGCMINAIYEDGWTVSIKSGYFIGVFVELLIITLIAYFLRNFFRVYHSYIGKVLLVLLLAGIIVEQIKTMKPEPLWLCLLSIFITMLINLNVIVMLFFMCVSIAFNFYTSGMAELPQKYILEIVGVVILIILNFSIYKTYLIEQKAKFLNEQTFKNESDHIQDILSLLVPKFIHKYLQDGEYNLQEAQDDVSILFCYVCNFDTVVKEEGRNIVHLMDELFRQFDQLCHSYAVQKIETVGMTYMAATGITAVEEQFDSYLTKKNPVERLLKMSEIMMEKAKGIVYGKNKDKRLTLKIGIHTGKVIIGVIGYHKPQFSLIGDTVNTTSRHCSTAKESQIVLSAAAFKKLKYKSYHFTVGKVFMKGLGEVDIYRWGKQSNPIKQVKDESLLQKNVRFRKIVRRVIEDLKKNNLIFYKPVLERIRNIFQVRTSSQRISSMKSFKSASGIIKLMLQQDRVQQTTAQTFNVHQLIIMALNYNISFSEFVCKKYSEKDIKIVVLSIIVLWLHYAGILVLLPFSPIQLGLRFVSTFFLIVSIVLLKKAYTNLYLRVLVLIIIGLVTVSSTFELFYIDDVVNINDFVTILLLILFTTIGRIQLFNLLELAIFGLIGCLTPLIISFAVNQSFNIECLIILFFYMGEVMSRKYNRLQLAETMYKELKIQERRSKEQEGLVSQLLPKHAFLKLRNQNLSNKIQLTDVIQDATLLFADIKGFTSYSNQNPAEQVVTMLRTLFSQFDKTCLKYNVYKVYTIGDCYVVLGFTNPFRRDIHQQAINVVNMGLAMVDIVHTVRQQIDFQQLDMRIGIHTGTIIGGIIGTDLVRYDIYGRDVMIANKFEEFGEIGKVHISSSTKAILESAEANFKMVPHGTVKIEKLNVELPGFLVSRRKFQ